MDRIRLRTAAARTDEGFTLVEVLTTLAIFGICLAISGVSVVGWTQKREHSGTADQLTSFLRQAQQRAQTEARDYCVTIDSATTWSMRKATPFVAGGDPMTRCVSAPVRPGSSEADAVTVSAGFTQFEDGSTATQVIFTARGTATPGEIEVERAGRSDIEISVEGLTGRVSTP